MQKTGRKFLFILTVLLFVFGFIGSAWSIVSLPTSGLTGSIPNPPAAIGSQLTFNITTGTVNYLDGVSFADTHAQDSFIGSSVNIISGGLRTGPATFSAASIEIRDLDGIHVYMTADLIDPLTGDITFTGAFPVYFLNLGLDVNDPNTLNLSNVVLYPDPIGHPSQFMDELVAQLGSGTDLGLMLNCTGDLGGMIPGFDCLINSGILDGLPPPSNNPPVAEAGVTFDQAQCLDTVCAVNLDGSASTDPDSSPGTNDDIIDFSWFEDLNGNGILGDIPEELIASGENVTVSLALGFHEIFLKVTDSQGETDVDAITVVVDAAELSFIEIKKAYVMWNREFIKIKGKLSLPAGVTLADVNSVGTAVINLSGGLGDVVSDSVDFEERRNGKKWRYHNSSAAAGLLRRFKIDWHGEKFKYQKDCVEVKSRHFGDDSTTIEVEFCDSSIGPVTVDFGGGITVNLDVSGIITVTGLASTEYDIDDCEPEVEIVLPYAIATTDVIDISGTRTDNFTVGDYYTAAVGKFKIKAKFDSGGIDPTTISPKQLTLDIGLGDEGYSGIILIDDADWTRTNSKVWKYKVRH